MEVKDVRPGQGSPGPPAPAWADFDGDGYPDLYSDQYVDWSWANNPPCNYDGNTTDVCPPKKFSGLQHKLFANLPARATKFRDVTAEAGLKPGGPESSKGLGVLAVDVNGDGKPDIYVCNDTVDNFLYINHSTPGHFRFEEVGVKSGTARDERGSPNGSMGVDAADYDGCGRPSIWVTNYEDEQHALYHNDCKGDSILFYHRTSSSGIGALGQKYVGWGTAFLDLDHDGWEDLFIADGHAIRYPTKPGSSRRQKPVLLRNQGDGKFKNLTAQGGPYFEKDHLSRGVGFGDLDNDGRIDAIVSHLNEPVSVLQNTANVDGDALARRRAGRQGPRRRGGGEGRPGGGRPDADALRQGRRQLRLVGRPPLRVRPGQGGQGRQGDGDVAEPGGADVRRRLAAGRSLLPPGSGPEGRADAGRQAMMGPSLALIGVGNSPNGESFGGS